MASDKAERFMEALRALERSGDVAEMVRLFSEDAALRRLSQREDYQGQGGAESFWREYLEIFERVDTRFDHVIEDGDDIVLEWQSHGSLPGGKPLRYQGVSIVRFGGGEVREFRTYYDSAAFVPEGASR
jgi:ketosteroid isomerase-like protein